MKTFFSLLLAIVLMINPITAGSEFERYEVVSTNDKENIILYAKNINGLFRDFKINFKGGIYSRPFWISETNPTYAPQIIYKDINKDQNKELIIIFNKRIWYRCLMGRSLCF